MSTSSKPRVAILDDYQHLAFKCADWSSVKSKIDITVFDDTIQPEQEDELVKRLEPFEVLCSMRERTKFPASLLKRLPNLKLLATTGPRNQAIDLPAAAEEGILVAGTGYAGTGTAEHKYVPHVVTPSHFACFDRIYTDHLYNIFYSWLLVMAVARGLVFEHDNTVNGHPQWQTRFPTELGGKTMGILGLGNLGKGTASVGIPLHPQEVA